MTLPDTLLAVMARQRQRNRPSVDVEIEPNGVYIRYPGQPFRFLEWDEYWGAIGAVNEALQCKSRVA